MFLKSVSIKNIRCIKDLHLPLTNDEGKIRQWSIILGDNGSGKSTILRSIVLLLSGSNAFAKLVDNIDTWIRKGENNGEIRAIVTSPKSYDQELKLQFIRGQDIRGIFDMNKNTFDVIDNSVKKSKKNYFYAGYGVSRRLSGEKKRNSIKGSDHFKDPRANRVATLFAPDAELIPFETWAMNLHYKKNETAIKLIKETLKNFLPEVEFRSIDKNKRQLMFETIDGMMPLEVLSDGFQNVISWCGDLLCRITETFNNYKNPLRSTGLLLIDEIGLHLHLKWQRVLREFISKKFPNLQIIATTHSPFTAHQAGEKELFSLIRNDIDPKTINLNQFDGTPNKLFLHQLMMTPFFGLKTMNSHEWQKIREEYNTLKMKKIKSLKEKNRFIELGKKLADQPDWSEGQPFYKEIKSLLEEIRDQKGEQR